MNHSFSSIQISGFAKRAIVGAMFLHAGQSLAGNSFNAVTDYYATQVFDEISHDGFVDLLVKSEKGDPLAKEFADAMLAASDSENDLALLRSSNANLVTNAIKLISSNPEKLYAIHKELKEGNYPEPLAIEALYQIHKVYDSKFEAFANAQRVKGSESAVAVKQSKPKVLFSDETAAQVDPGNVQVKSYDEFTWFSAPAESLTLNNASYFNEDLSSKRVFDPLDALALMPVETCDFVEPVVEAVKEEPKDTKLFVTDVALKVSELQFSIPVIPVGRSLHLVARKDDEYAVKSMIERDNKAYSSSVFFRESDFSSVKEDSSLWLLLVDYS